MIFETLHLDLEGGVGERRTTPAPNTWVNVIDDASKKEGGKGDPLVKIHSEGGEPGSVATPSKKKKKVVGFASEKPEISLQF